MTDKARNIFTKVIAYLFFSAFGAAAIFMTYAVIDALIDTNRAKNWIQVEGKLIEQRLDVTEKTFKSVNDFSAPSKRLTASYTYTVDENSFTGDQVDFSDGHADNFSSDRKEAQQKLLAQEPLIVYVNPENPAESVIDPSLPAEQVLFFTCFLLFPCGFAVMVIIGTLMLPFKRWRKLTTPLCGIFHGGMAFWVLIFHHASYGFLGNGLLLLMSGLLFAGLYYLVRHDKLNEAIWKQSD